jgi:predicted nucleic acid-binding protein
MLFAAVVADANVLLSAAIGKAALKVMTKYQIEVHATEFNVAEVEEYLPRLISKYRLIDEEVYLHWRVLPIVVHGETYYESEIERARADLAERDPDDAHPLALARSLKIPLWSNDRDLLDLGVDCYDTSRLLGLLEREASPGAP